MPPASPLGSRPRKVNGSRRTTAAPKIDRYRYLGINDELRFSRAPRRNRADDDDRTFINRTGVSSGRDSV